MIKFIKVSWKANELVKSNEYYNVLEGIFPDGINEAMLVQSGGDLDGDTAVIFRKCKVYQRIWLTVKDTAKWLVSELFE